MSKKKIVVLTGAGISAESGIKTFRDMDGLWYEHNVEDVASINGWRKNKQLVLDFYNERRKQLYKVQPNGVHYDIVELENDYDVTVITQNVDDLHERAGSTNVIHLHGELTKMCSSRNKELTLPYENDINIGDKHEDGSQLRPYIVWFGESVPKIYEAVNYLKGADIVVIIGTSLQVYPAASLIEQAPMKAQLYYIDPNPASTFELAPDISERLSIIEQSATLGMKTFIDMLNNNK